MSTNNLRWRVSDAVRRALFRTDDSHPLHRLYVFARRIPGVHQLWRLIDVHRSTAKAFRAYVDGGGVFGAMTPYDVSLPPVVDFEDEAFFPNLIARITAMEQPAPQPSETIAIINNGLSAGGAERQIVNTMLGLKARGVPAVFIGEYLDAAPGQDFHLARLLAAGVDARQLQRVARPSNRLFAEISQPVAEQLFRMEPTMLLEILDMVQALRGLRPSVAHLWQDDTSIKHTISALIAGVPRIILSGRNLNPTHFLYHKLHMFHAYKAFLAHPRIVFSNNSHAGAASYAAWLGAQAAAIRVVHNGFDFAAWPPFDENKRQAMRRRMGVGGATPLVVGVFRLAQEKRPLLWAEVAAEALKMRPDLCFAIAGEGPMRKDLEERIDALGLRDRLKLVGKLQNVDELLMASDAFLLTSAQEGIPNVLLEAQWYGRPVLTTLAGGTAEAMEDGVTGRIAESGSTADVARDLVSLLDDTALAAGTRTEGPAFVRQTFSSERMVEESLRLYRG